MKKDKLVLLGVCFAFLVLIIGVFISRNIGDDPYDTVQSEMIETADTDARLDINEMSAAQLEAIPGIGEMLAKRIVAYREANGPFRTLEEVMNVEGIGEKKLDQIASLVKVGG